MSQTILNSSHKIWLEDITCKKGTRNIVFQFFIYIKDMVAIKGTFQGLYCIASLSFGHWNKRISKIYQNNRLV